jgi:hypothetical protein
MLMDEVQLGHLQFEVRLADEKAACAPQRIDLGARLGDALFERHHVVVFRLRDGGVALAVEGAEHELRHPLHHLDALGTAPADTPLGLAEGGTAVLDHALLLLADFLEALHVVLGGLETVAGTVEAERLDLDGLLD